MRSEEEKVEHHRGSISHSFSYDGYELLHDEAMDKISVSIHFNDHEEIADGSSRESFAKMSKNHEKKMKISLSQEQLRLNCGSKNFLSVPRSSRTNCSASFSIEDEKSVQVPLVIESNTTKDSESSSNANKVISLTPPRITTNEVVDDEIIYAVPRKNSSPSLSVKEENEAKTSSASPSPSKSVATAQTSAFNRDFKFPLSLYCKICSNVLSDPRTLDCLHSFCVQCLARLDASNDLQNNQFWRKISEHSDLSSELINCNATTLPNYSHWKFKLRRCRRARNQTPSKGQSSY